MRTFELIRVEDVSGLSGTGAVAEGVEFSDGTCAMRWKSSTASTALYSSMADLLYLHGHEGASFVQWENGDTSFE